MPSIPQEVVERLARMEQAIDAVAIEIERISEAQRFTTRLLSERVPDPRLAAPGQGTPNDAASVARQS